MKISKKTIFFISIVVTIHRITGLFFYAKNEQRCFFMDIPRGTNLRIEYLSPDTNDKKTTYVSIYGPINKEIPITETITKDKGTIPFLNQHSGEHWICVGIDNEKYHLPSDTIMRFEFRIVIGNNEEYYQDMAKKEHMDELTLQILKLKDRVREIQRQQDYAKEKDVQFMQTSESNNSRAMWVSIIQIGVLLFTGFFQVRYLRSYFYKKKLV